MNTTFRLLAVLFATVAWIQPGAVAAQQSSPFDELVIPQLRDQDIDVNQSLLEALQRARQRGAILQFSEDAVEIDLELGGLGERTLRLTNAGDQVAEIRGINTVAPVPDLEILNGCPEELGLGDFCDIRFSYVGRQSGVLQTALILTTNERERSSVSMPLVIRVAAPPAPPLPAPVVLPPPPPPAPAQPTAEDIARQYFAARGGIAAPAAERGFTRISAPPAPLPSRIVGHPAEGVHVETIWEDPRFDPSIPHAFASLPVNRDRIITADRVIKAVLETPVSNILCGKVVATIESDVFSATSNVPLIQAGSRATGTCGAFVDERVAIRWDRIITTDGRSITFTDTLADSNDAGGLAGVPGRIHARSRDRFVLPILSTAIDTIAGIVMVNYGETTEVRTTPEGERIEQESARNEGARIITESMRDTGQQVIGEIRDTRRVSIVPAGTRLDIEIREDIYFRSERQVVRLADMIYNVPDREAADAQLADQPGVRLAPWTAGATGPVVMIGGQRFVLEEAPPPTVDEWGNPLPRRAQPAESLPPADGAVRAGGSDRSVDDTLRDIAPGHASVQQGASAPQQPFGPATGGWQP